MLQLSVDVSLSDAKISVWCCSAVNQRRLVTDSDCSGIDASASGFFFWVFFYPDCSCLECGRGCVNLVGYLLCITYT